MSILGGLGSAIGSIAGLAAGSRRDRAAEERLAMARRLYETMQLPEFDMRQLSPDELSVVAEYMPEFYDFVPPSEAPTTVQEGPEGRDAQLSALDYFNKVRTEGLPTLERIAAQEAQGAVANQASRDRETVLREAQMRGQGGRSGTALGAMLAGGQQSANLARGFGDDLARNAVLSRLQAASQGAGIGGQMRGQDIQKSALNADIWNRFNEFVSSGLTEANRYAANARQAASNANVGERQRVADTNTDLRNRFSLRNQDYLNTLRQSQYGNEFDRRRGMAGELGNEANLQLARGSAENASLQSIGEGLGKAVGGAVGGEDKYEQLRTLLRELRG